MVEAMISCAPEECTACWYLSKQYGDIGEPVLCRNHVAAQAREIEELRVLVRDVATLLKATVSAIVEEEYRGPDLFQLLDRAEAALAKPHAGKGP
jgi:hypothetical protein